MRLLSWNIQSGRGMDGRVDLNRILADIDAMGGFDVIALQEVAVGFHGLPGGQGEDQVAILAAGLPSHTPIFACATDLPGPNGRRKQFGNALFSRFPVLQVFRHLLPWPSDPGVPSMQRVMLEAVLDTGTDPIRMTTTHLEYYSATQRMAQIDAIRRLHREACAHARRPRTGEGESDGPFAVLPRPASTILCGDMNFPAEASDRKRLLAPFDTNEPIYLDAWERLHPSTEHAPTVGIHKVYWVDRPVCFDYFFLSEDLLPRLQSIGVNAVTSASDHQPVWIELD